MKAENIMTSRLFTLKPDDTVAEALRLMHSKHVRNLPVVDSSGVFVGLFGLRRLSHLLLPIAASDLGRYSLTDLHFLPDESVLVGERWQDIANHPVVDYLEKKKKLLFCEPDTKFPELLALLEESKDSTLPVIVLKGMNRKLVGVVSAWDVLETVILEQLMDKVDNPAPSND